MKRKPGSVGTKHRIDWHEYPVRLENSTEILKNTMDVTQKWTGRRKVLGPDSLSAGNFFSERLD
ncbi:MAG: hypothetical protein L6276_14155 [Acetobacterium sp.]|uniref:hypothetical protein n=1 Tax=Acetobacterium wieringae TaxID=52694 RepID=UPI0011DFB08F|nr:hypothetical protein [Acetobacterium wieringae]MBU4438677.1 hypothetical protein [Bacillota bacterium]MCG2731401.1 hypothetical protein [Acetobacterium sp.]